MNEHSMDQRLKVVEMDVSKHFEVALEWVDVEVEKEDSQKEGVVVAKDVVE
jgi:hypothetical protein